MVPAVPTRQQIEGMHLDYAYLNQRWDAALSMMRMEWKYNDRSKMKMTINKKCNVSIDEIMIALDYTNNKTDLPCTSSSFS